MTLGANDLHPLRIEDARESAYQASVQQRNVEEELRNASQDLAEQERAYRKELSQRILGLKAEGHAITACSEIARGEKLVADLRYQRDVAEGIYKAVEQQAYRRAADRKDVHQLLNWSMQRDFRTEG